MKLIFCVILTLAVSNFNVDSSAVGMAKELEKSYGDDRATKFIDLDRDSMAIIFEYLNFDDLLKVAEVDDNLSVVAADVFRYKYSNLQIIVDAYHIRLPNDPNELLTVAGMEIDNDTIARTNEKIRNESSNSTVSKTQIENLNGDKLLKTFKYFGRFIKKFKAITAPGNTDSWLQAELIYKLISKHSSESLIEIEFKGTTIDWLQQLKEPLINVAKVTFDDSFTLRHKKNTSMLHPELFPAMRYLSLDSLGDFFDIYFNRHMPHLEHVYVGTSTLFKPIPNVIVKNPQIRSVDLYSADPEFVEKANTFLPQLETLKLTLFHLKTGSIQFENVTTFSIGMPRCVSYPTNLHFPKLRTLHVEYGAGDFAKYSPFLNEHSQLKHLHITHFEFEGSEFQQLTANLQALEELTLNVYMLTERICSTIVEFLNSHDNVNRVNVNYINFRYNNELEGRLGQEWETTFNETGLHINRRTTNQH